MASAAIARASEGRACASEQPSQWSVQLVGQCRAQCPARPRAREAAAAVRAAAEWRRGGLETRGERTDAPAASRGGWRAGRSSERTERGGSEVGLQSASQQSLKWYRWKSLHAEKRRKG